MSSENKSASSLSRKKGRGPTFCWDLLRWYKKNKRKLPWRLNKDPYRIWISEIMLQQTRVEAVIPYYEKFLLRFPSPTTLAQASEDEVTAYWAGLGYYSRAKNLHLAAKVLVKNCCGNFPTNYEDLLQLPGIGPYTASAISSIAYAEKRAAIDGNLERVLSRILALRDNPKSSAGAKAIYIFANDLIQYGHAGDINEALMDLSSSICAVKNPACSLCPIQKHCTAYKQNLTEVIPSKKEKKQSIPLRSKAIVILHQSDELHVLLVRRPKNAWLSGMWDIPWWIENSEMKNEQEARRLEKDIFPLLRKGFFKKIGDFESQRTITQYKVSTRSDFFLLQKPRKTLDTYLRVKKIPFQWEGATRPALPKPSMQLLHKALHACLYEIK